MRDVPRSFLTIKCLHCTSFLTNPLSNINMDININTAVSDLFLYSQTLRDISQQHAQLDCSPSRYWYMYVTECHNLHYPLPLLVSSLAKLRASRALNQLTQLCPTPTIGCSQSTPRIVDKHPRPAISEVNCTESTHPQLNPNLGLIPPAPFDNRLCALHL